MLIFAHAIFFGGDLVIKFGVIFESCGTRRLSLRFGSGTPARGCRSFKRALLETTLMLRMARKMSGPPTGLFAAGCIPHASVRHTYVREASPSKATSTARERLRSNTRIIFAPLAHLVPEGMFVSNRQPTSRQETKI